MAQSQNHLHPAPASYDSLVENHPTLDKIHLQNEKIIFIDKKSFESIPDFSQGRKDYIYNLISSYMLENNSIYTLENISQCFSKVVNVNVTIVQSAYEDLPLFKLELNESASRA